MVMTDFTDTPFGDWLKQEAVPAKVATEEEMVLWVGRLNELSEAGFYYSSANMVIVAGRKSL